MCESFRNVVLPVRCPCGVHEVYASLDDLCHTVVTVDCESCGGSFSIDVRINAAQFVGAITSHPAFPATPDVLPVTVALERH